MHSDETIAEALKMYKDRRDLTTAQIAEKYDIWPSTLTNWAIRAKVPLRPRGPRGKKEPSPEHQEILELCVHYPQSVVAEMKDFTRQHVSRIVARWKNWKPGNYGRCPFNPGDIIEHFGKHYRVIGGGPIDGIVADSGGRKINFKWFSRGRMARKEELKLKQVPRKKK